MSSSESYRQLGDQELRSFPIHSPCQNETQRTSDNTPLPSEISEDDHSSVQSAGTDTSHTLDANRQSIAEDGFTIRSSSPAIAYREPLKLGHSESSLGKRRFVKWGVAWSYPVYMTLWVLAGFACALGHHLYYSSLNGTEAGSSSRQSWVVRIGTAFAFLVVSCFRAACDVAYKQYIWLLFKRRSYRLKVLDKLFYAPSDPTAFLSLDFWKGARVASLVATVCWSVILSFRYRFRYSSCINVLLRSMALLGIVPPGTMTVVQGLRNETRPTSLAAINWTSPAFFDVESDVAQPSSEVLRIASISAQSMAVVSSAPPASNSSYDLQFYGPSVQCSLANSSQHALFERYSKDMANNTLMLVTKAEFETGRLRWAKIPDSRAPLMNVYSAFSPTSGNFGWLTSPEYVHLPVDAYNNWAPGWWNISYASAFQLPTWNTQEFFSTQQLWIQTGDQSMVCTLGNASFSVAIEFVNSVQTVARYNVSHFEPFWMPELGAFTALEPLSPVNQSETWRFDNINPFYSYMAVYLAFSGLMNGNVSTSLTNSFLDYELNGISKHEFDGNVTVYDGSSKILQHGLSACSDFTHGYVCFHLLNSRRRF